MRFISIGAAGKSIKSLGRPSLADPFQQPQTIVDGHDQIVRLKRTANAPVSYQFLRKRFEFFKMVHKRHFAKVTFTVLEEQMFGVPIYKQDWFRQRRAARSIKNRAS